MCFYLTSTLPKDADLDQLRPIFNDFNMGFHPIENEYIQSQLRSQELYFRATNAYCDCDTVIGSQINQQAYQNLMNSKKVKTLRKKQWSEAQIEAWILKKLKTKKPKQTQNLTPLEKDLELRRWTDFIHIILQNSSVSRVGLIKHWYDGGLENEKFIIRETKEVKASDISPEFLLNLREDILYEFYS